MTSCSCLEIVRRQKRRGSWLRSKMAASTNEAAERWAAERWAAERWAGPDTSGPCCSACLRYSANDLGSSPVGASGCARGVWSMFPSWSCQTLSFWGREEGKRGKGGERGMVRRPRKVIEGLRYAMAREILEAFIVRVWEC